MTKKTRMIVLICIAFLSAIVLFTAGFLAYLQADPGGAGKTLEEGAGSLSSGGNLDFGDLTSLGLICAVLVLIIYLIAKS